MAKIPTVQVEKVLYSLPRFYKGPLNARAWIDGSGQICIDLEGGGALVFTEGPDDVYTVTGGEDL